MKRQKLTNTTKKRVTFASTLTSSFPPTIRKKSTFSFGSSTFPSSYKVLTVPVPLLILGYKVVSGLNMDRISTKQVNSNFELDEPELILVSDASFIKTLYLAYKLLRFEKVGILYSPVVKINKWNTFMNSIQTGTGPESLFKSQLESNGVQFDPTFVLHNPICSDLTFVKFQ